MKHFTVLLLFVLSQYAQGQSWSQTPSGYPYNYLTTVDEFVQEWVTYYNATGSTVHYDSFEDTINQPAEVWGAESQAPPWTSKFTPRTSEHATQGHLVSWDGIYLPANKASDAYVVWSTEDGAQTWVQNGGGQIASRTRTWYTYLYNDWTAPYQP